jgi:lipoprotein-anchoring transpeptidase ErfK/SrfK
MEQEQIVNEGRAQEMLKSAVEVAKVGQRNEAYRLLRRVVVADPSNEVAWFWLAGVTDQPAEALAALDRVEQLNPGHPKLADAKRWAQARLASAAGHRQGNEPSQPPPPSLADSTQPIQPTTRHSSAATLAVAPVSGSSSRSAWPRRLLITLISLAVVLGGGMLALVAWSQVSLVQAELPALSTPDNSQRVLALQPELNVALAESRWEDAIAVLQVMRALDPQNLALTRELASVYYQLALERRDRGDLEGAVVALDESLTLVPDDPAVQQERWLADAYLQGMLYHQAGDWQATIRTLVLVHRQVPTYLDVIELLYSAYYNLGFSQQAAGDLIGAQASYQAAVALMPDEPLARDKADEVAWLLRPPTPTPIPTPVPTLTPTPTPEPNPQRIIVDVSEQRMYVYQGGNLLWKWVVSTGEPGRDTAIGQFAVQSKIKNAYASTWNLDMPYWLGIYWSGPMENGIHALPIQRATGYKLWDGYLGQRVSYGCVILSDENAQTLFNWAKIGTPVIIQP